MKLALIFASLLAFALAHIEVTQQLDGSKVEMIDDVLGQNPFRDGSGIFKRSVLEGGLGFGGNRERRWDAPPIVLCAPHKTAITTVYGPGSTTIKCHERAG